MRLIPLQRVGEYLQVAIQIISENNNEFPTRLLIPEMRKRLQPSGYEVTTSKTGAVRWITKFRFWTIGLVKGGYIKKEKKKWYLTKAGESLLERVPQELVKISGESYKQWYESRQDIGEEKTTEEALEGVDPIDISFTNLRIKPLPINFKDLMRGVEKSTIQIPPFQRNFVWSRREIIELLDSIYNGYPIGSFIFWKTLKRLPRHREIGGEKLNEVTPGLLIDYVIDGQQRITSLYAAVKCAEIEEERTRFYFDLTTGKFDYSRITTDDNESEDEEEEEEERQDIDYTLVPLDKLFVDAVEYFSYVDKFPTKFKPVLNDLYNKFKDYAFSVIYIQNQEEDRDIENNKRDIEKIVKIFLRINDTGRKLTVVAKMIAMCWEKDFNLRDKLNKLLPPDSELSEIREETILQIASVILNDKKCRSRNILNDTNIRELEEKWDEIIRAFNLSLSFLKDKIRIKNFKYLPFDSLLIPISYFHYHNNNPSNNQSETLFRWFWLASLSNHYSSTVESKIEQDCVLFDELLKDNEVKFGYLIDWDSLKSNLINQKYHFRNAFCKTVLSLYSYNMPKHFRDNREISIAESFSEYSKAHLHHIFPKKYLLEINNEFVGLRDSIVNIVLAPAVLNREMGHRAPSDYLSDYAKENSEINETLKSHFITDQETYGLIDNNFDTFLNRRAEAIENKFRELGGLTTKTERQLEEEPNRPVDFIENKFREIIDKQLIDEIPNYWQDVVPSDIRSVVVKKIEHEKKKHPYLRDVDYSNEEKLAFLDIMDYFKIILSNWTYFSEIFGSKSELEKHFSSLKEYRNCLKHNRKMDEITKKNGEAAVLWFERIIENFEEEN